MKKKKKKVIFVLYINWVAAGMTLNTVKSTNKPHKSLIDYFFPPSRPTYNPTIASVYLL